MRVLFWRKGRENNIEEQIRGKGIPIFFEFFSELLVFFKEGGVCVKFFSQFNIFEALFVCFSQELGRIFMRVRGEKILKK